VATCPEQVIIVSLIDSDVHMVPLPLQIQYQLLLPLLLDLWVQVSHISCSYIVT